MIGVDKVLGVIELAVWSGHIENEQPVSVLVTAPVEAGKTEMVRKFKKNTGCLSLTDATAFGIMRDYGQAIVNKEIRHIIIHDLVKPMSRGKDTVHSFVAFLNSLIEEGVFRVSTYAEKIGAPSQGVSTSMQGTPIKCGLIATLAKDVLLDGRHHWSRMGFMSRLVPVSFTYNVSTQVQIHQSIAARTYTQDPPVMLNLPVIDVKVNLPQKEADDLTLLSEGLTSMMNGNNQTKNYGFRLHKNIQRLAMASAIKDGRDIVNQTDVARMQDLASCINLEYYPL